MATGRLEWDCWRIRRSLRAGNRTGQIHTLQQRLLRVAGSLASEHQMLTPHPCRSRDKHYIIDSGALIRQLPHLIMIPLLPLW